MICIVNILSKYFIKMKWQEIRQQYIWWFYFTSLVEMDSASRGSVAMATMG